MFSHQLPPEIRVRTPASLRRFVMRRLAPAFTS